MSIVLATVAIWSLWMRHGAAIHDYWPYFGVAAIAVSVAVVIELLSDALARFAPRLRPMGFGVLVIAVALLGGSALYSPSKSQKGIEHGIAAGRLTETIERADAPTQIVFYTDLTTIAGSLWADWTTRGTSKDILPNDLKALSRTDPDAVVLSEFFFPLELYGIADSDVIANDGAYYLLRARAFAGLD